MSKSYPDTIKDLVDYLNVCRDQYYNHSNSIISDQQYDELFDQLVELEKESGIVLCNSPTQTVGYPIMEGYEEVTHEEPLLSLAKTQDYSQMQTFCNDKDVLFMWKADGLTVQLTYEDGEFVSATTRGDGKVGKVCTTNARTFYGVPKTIPVMGHVKVTGEAIILKKDFDYINSLIPDESEKFANQRNLASGSVNTLDSSVCASRKVHFVVWNANSFSENGTMLSGLLKAKEYGFDIVHWTSNMGIPNSTDSLRDVFENMRKRSVVEGFPIDGIVAMYNNIEYGKSLGRTEHHFRNGLAFKFYDEQFETTITGVDFTIGKTGVFTPTAVFDPVEIDGTEVSRASVHNISILHALNLCIGDLVTVYKANQIIPQIGINKTKHSDLNAYHNLIPTNCPHCGHELKIVTSSSGVQDLMCMNGNCPGILLKKFNAFVSKNAMDIDGLSGKTLEKLVDNGTLVKYSDIYKLRPCDIMTLPGFGNKSTQKLLQAIHDSKNTTLQKVLTGLNIDNVGKKVAEQVSKLFNNDPQLIIQEFSWIDAEPVYRKLSSIEGVGDTIVWSIINWFNKEDNFEEFRTLVSVLKFEQNSKQTGTNLNGMKFVITGSVTRYKNRDELANVITSNGGTVQSGVNKETTYLINNDVNSTSSKNKKAKELGVKIISEDDFIKLLGSEPKNKTVKRGLF